MEGVWNQKEQELRNLPCMKPPHTVPGEIPEHRAQIKALNTAGHGPPK